MFRTDRDALICDLAETYHIFDYKSLPCTRVAAFCVGLRNNSRIKMKMSGMKYPLETMLLASAVDRLSMLLWSRSKDVETGTGKPNSIVQELLGSDKEVEIFNTAEEFEKRRKALIGEGGA